VKLVALVVETLIWLQRLMCDVVSNGLVFLLQNYRIRISSIIKMEDSIHERIGQRHAVVSVSKAIRRARVGLRDPSKLQVLYSLDQLVLEKPN
jgi:hypothetical protein